jgi:hypothetical protein
MDLFHFFMSFYWISYLAYLNSLIYMFKRTSISMKSVSKSSIGDALIFLMFPLIFVAHLPDSVCARKTSSFVDILSSD